MMTPDQVSALCHRTVGEVVAEDYRRADVFMRFGIDFCCGGDRRIIDACSAKGVACEDVLEALVEVDNAPLAISGVDVQVDVRSWPPDFLASYIVNVHHRYVRERLPVLRELTQTVARVHGDSNPEAIRIAALFSELGKELAEHTDREEQELFPHISALVAADGNGEALNGSADVSDETVNELMEDHDHAGALLREIRTLSHDYAPPDDACNTYRLAYAGLEAFESDLHRHVHLENNVLFPAVRRMRSALQVGP